MSNEEQYEFLFDDVKWPDQNSYPLNFKELGRSVEATLYEDIESSKEYIVITGFTSLSNLIDFFGSNEFSQLKKVRILIGFEPNIRGRKRYLKSNLDKEIKEYWLKKGLSIILGGAVINLIEKINSGRVEFKFKDKLHAKIYVGDEHALLGSSNFSKNGLTAQEEANIRVDSNSEQYLPIKQIAESYYDDALPYNEKIKDLLEGIIKEVSWQEALARAIAELIEGEWLSGYRDILAKLEKTKLWPTQWKGITQAVSILQSHSNVLIADPTGAGKTKLCTALVLAFKHWLYQIGEAGKANSLVVCPPLVIEKWQKEYSSLKQVNNNQVSMGVLSSTTSKKTKGAKQHLENVNILTVDEAHNFLSPDSNRTKLINTNRAEFKILVTATPISKRVEDILRLIDLLDLDNLTDDDFEKYKSLIRKRGFNRNEEDIDTLRKFISKFTVRRTKKTLNKEISKSPENYVNKLGFECKFPQQNEKIYRTNETKEDIKLVQEINRLASQLKGLTYLSFSKKPIYDFEEEEDIKQYIQNRIHAGKALSVYMIRSAIRSSHVALVEHVEGSQSAMDYFNFGGKTNKTGNKLATIQKILDNGRKPRRNKVFPKDFFPDWLADTELYLKACKEEYSIYQRICALAKQMSGSREKGKVQELIKLSEKHNDILAFDSTVITLYYLKSLFDKEYPTTNVFIGSGSEKKGAAKVLERFNLESKTTERQIALCSDQMSESVDLQKASCLMLLDLPSVLRVVEQRIGRVDRMDSMHKSIDIYWPDDSEEYSLKADRRLVETNRLVDQIYGTNFKVPESITQKHFNNVESVEDMQEEYKEFSDKDESWSGLSDSFQSIINLKEGDNPIIEESTYEEFKDVSASIKTRVSFVNSDRDWCFLALRGDKSKSPKWYFIDSNKEIHFEFIDVCQQLREHVSGKSNGAQWNDSYLKEYISILKKNEQELLPPKKKRALAVAKYILEKRKAQKETHISLKTTISEMLELLAENSDLSVDFERLAEEWVTILQPYLNDKRAKNRIRTRVFNLNSLKAEWRDIDINVEMLQGIIENNPIVEDIDSKIASCIIGVGK